MYILYSLIIAVLMPLMGGVSYAQMAINTYNTSTTLGINNDFNCEDVLLNTDKMRLQMTNKQIEEYELACSTYVPKDKLLDNYIPVLQGSGLKQGLENQRREVQAISRSANLPRLIIGYVKLFGQIIAVLSVMGIVYAGYLYIFQWTGASKETALKIIQYVVIGIFIVFAGYPLILMVIKALFGELEFGLGI